jgi:hypothetical protein
VIFIGEMMTFLLQFFLNHQCVDRNQILNWYDKDIHGYKGFNLAKQLATPFIRSFSTSQTGKIQYSKEIFISSLLFQLKSNKNQWK